MKFIELLCLKKNLGRKRRPQKKMLRFPEGQMKGLGELCV